jgi:hypothetical protein
MLRSKCRVFRFADAFLSGAEVALNTRASWRGGQGGGGHTRRVDWLGESHATSVKINNNRLILQEELTRCPHCECGLFLAFNAFDVAILDRMLLMREEISDSTCYNVDLLRH